MRIRDHDELIRKCLPSARNVDDFAIMIFMAQEPHRRLQALKNLAGHFLEAGVYVPKTTEQEFFHRGINLVALMDKGSMDADFSESVRNSVRDLSGILEVEEKFRQVMASTLQAAVADKLKDNLPLASKYHDGCQVNHNARVFAQHFIMLQSEEDQLFCLVHLAKEEFAKTSGGETYFRGESFFTRALSSFLSHYNPRKTVLADLLEIAKKNIEDDEKFLREGFKLVCQIKIAPEVLQLMKEIYLHIGDVKGKDAVVSGLICLRYINSAIILCSTTFEGSEIQTRLIKLTKLIQAASNNNPLPEGYGPRFASFQAQFLPTKACSL